jgi:DNA-binding MarR family transcriptional regulator
MNIEEALKMTKFADETHKATLNVLYSAYWLKNHYSSALKDMGLTIEQFNVMRILRGKHPEKMCVKDIADRTIEKNSNVPRIIDRLYAKQYVERTTSPADKRETHISLTEQGLEALQRANAIMKQISEQVICIDNNDATTLNALLEKLRGVEGF